MFSRIYKLPEYLVKHSVFLTIHWQPKIIIKSTINYRYVVKTIEIYMA